MALMAELVMALSVLVMAAGCRSGGNAFPFAYSFTQCGSIGDIVPERRLVLHCSKLTMFGQEDRQL